MSKKRLQSNAEQFVRSVFGIIVFVALMLGALAAISYTGGKELVNLLDSLDNDW